MVEGFLAVEVVVVLPAATAAAAAAAAAAAVVVVVVVAAAAAARATAVHAVTSVHLGREDAQVNGSFRHARPQN